MHALAYMCSKISVHAWHWYWRPVTYMKHCRRKLLSGLQPILVYLRCDLLVSSLSGMTWLASCSGLLLVCYDLGLSFRLCLPFCALDFVCLAVTDLGLFPGPCVCLLIQYHVARLFLSSVLCPNLASVN